MSNRRNGAGGLGRIVRQRKAPVAGDVVVVPVEALRPTQMAVGMRAVTFKRRKFESRVTHRKQARKVLSDKPIPTVRGPGGELFMIDNHHFGLALWQAEVDRAYARIIDDRSGLDVDQFWRSMEADGCLYPYDEDGRRIDPSRLPIWLHALRHDPYRDLAWAVREAGGFRKVRRPFAEFHWANYFRGHIALSTVRRNHEMAVRRALKICRLPGAAQLPGYLSEAA